MSKKLMLIAFGALIVSTPMAAAAQAVVPPDETGHPQPGSGIRGGTVSRTPTAMPRNTTTSGQAAQCFNEANAKVLQGKLRKKFLAQCKKRRTAV